MVGSLKYTDEAGLFLKYVDDFLNTLDATGNLGKYVDNFVAAIGDIFAAAGKAGKHGDDVTNAAGEVAQDAEKYGDDVANAAGEVAQDAGKYAQDVSEGAGGINEAAQNYIDKAVNAQNEYIDKGVNSMNNLIDKTTEGAGETKLYRVMSDAEYQSIINNGGKFSTYDRAMEEKWFATSPEDAAKWAEKFYPDGRYRMIEVDVPTDSLNQMYQVGRLDGIGPAYSGGIDFLNSIMKGLRLK